MSVKMLAAITDAIISRGPESAARFLRSRPDFLRLPIATALAPFFPASPDGGFIAHSGLSDCDATIMNNPTMLLVLIRRQES